MSDSDSLLLKLLLSIQANTKDYFEIVSQLSPFAHLPRVELYFKLKSTLSSSRPIISMSVTHD